MAIRLFNNDGTYLSVCSFPSVIEAIFSCFNGVLIESEVLFVAPNEHDEIKKQKKLMLLNSIM
jgi:hypothetical protein